MQVVLVIFYFTCRLNRTVSAVVSEENAVGSNFSGTDVFKLTYLEVGFRFFSSGSFLILLKLFIIVHVVTILCLGKF